MWGLAMLMVLAATEGHAQTYGGGQQGRRTDAYAHAYSGVWSSAAGGSSIQFQSDGLQLEGKIVQPSRTMQGAGVGAGTVAFRGKVNERSFDGQVLESFGDPNQVQRLRQSCNVGAFWAPARGTLSMDHKTMDMVYFPFLLVRDGNACHVYNPVRDPERYQHWLRQGQNSWIASQAKETTGQMIRRQ
jgi:hypothetical protein